MTLCFQSFSYSSNIDCSVNMHVNKSQPKKSSGFTSFSSSIIPRAERNDDQFMNSVPVKSSNFSSPVSGQPNAVGIIGVGPINTTLKFAKKMVRFSWEPEENDVPFVLSSDPALSRDLLSLASSPSLFPKAKTESIDPSSVVERLRLKRISLEKSGVCCVVLPCHTPHTWYDEIREGCSVPFLHMGECVAKELKEEKFRPIEAGSPVRIGILSTHETLVAKFYQEKLENEGFEVIHLDKITIEHTVIPAVEALKRYDYEGAHNLFRIALQFLLTRAVNRIILASDEYQEFLPPTDPLWFRCIDPMDALASAAVKYARSAGRSK